VSSKSGARSESGCFGPRHRDACRRSRQPGRAAGAGPDLSGRMSSISPTCAGLAVTTESAGYPATASTRRAWLRHPCRGRSAPDRGHTARFFFFLCRSSLATVGSLGGTRFSKSEAARWLHTGAGISLSAVRRRPRTWRARRRMEQRADPPRASAFRFFELSRVACGGG